MEEEVNRKAAAYKSVLLPTYEERENKGVTSNFLLKIPCHALWRAPKMNTMLNYADDKDSNSISAAAIEWHIAINYSIHFNLFLISYLYDIVFQIENVA